MFKIFELDTTNQAPPVEIGQGYATREAALVAVKRHLKGFGVSGHNRDEDYWWSRDSQGLRKCWIAPDC